jgi:hypothetical protein
MGDACDPDQVCACEQGWKNHGEYVSCVGRAARALVAARQISREQKTSIERGAGRSGCGKKPRRAQYSPVAPPPPYEPPPGRNRPAWAAAGG